MIFREEEVVPVVADSPEDVEKSLKDLLEQRALIMKKAHTEDSVLNIQIPRQLTAGE